MQQITCTLRNAAVLGVLYACHFVTFLEFGPRGGNPQHVQNISVCECFHHLASSHDWGKMHQIEEIDKGDKRHHRENRKVRFLALAALPFGRFGVACAFLTVLKKSSTHKAKTQWFFTLGNFLTKAVQNATHFQFEICLFGLHANHDFL